MKSREIARTKLGRETLTRNGPDSSYAPVVRRSAAYDGALVALRFPTRAPPPPHFASADLERLPLASRYGSIDRYPSRLRKATPRTVTKLSVTTKELQSVLSRLSSSRHQSSSLRSKLARKSSDDLKTRTYLVHHRAPLTARASSASVPAGREPTVGRRGQPATAAAPPERARPL